MVRQKQSEYKCPLEATLEIIGGKYKGITIGYLINKTLRYNELQKLIPQATPKMLIQQLKELERDGIIKRTLYFLIISSLVVILEMAPSKSTIEF